MSQNDMVIANANGATVRADINSALQALASSNGGATAPSTTYANQFWFDTVNDQLKIRDEANANWVVIASLVGTTWVPFSNGSALGTLANLNAASIGTALALGTNIGLAQALTAVSSGTPNFASSGNTVSLSGTATANTLGTVQAGFIGVIHYGIAVTVTHNATSRILPGAASINFAIGDVETVLSLGSGNWRTIAVTRASGLPLPGVQVLTKTASYTVTDSDNGAVIEFSGLAADATLNLPAASGRSGFKLYVTNRDTGFFGVVIDPNASETIDTFTTRKGYVGTRVEIICDGTGWKTIQGRYRYISGTFTPTAAATTGALGHGLGVIPNVIQVQMVCLTADAGYAVNDNFHYTATGDGAAGAQTGLSIIKDATNLTVRVASGGILIPNKTSGSGVGITAANWAMRFIAEE